MICQKSTNALMTFCLILVAIERCLCIGSNACCSHITR